MCGDFCATKRTWPSNRFAEMSVSQKLPMLEFSARASAAVAPAAEIVLLSEAESVPLRKFYVEEMRPFLRQSKSRGSRLADETRASSVFANLRTLVPAAARDTLADLED